MICVVYVVMCVVCVYQVCVVCEHYFHSVEEESVVKCSVVTTDRLS